MVPFNQCLEVPLNVDLEATNPGVISLVVYMALYKYLLEEIQVML